MRRNTPAQCLECPGNSNPSTLLPHTHLPSSLPAYFSFFQSSQGLSAHIKLHTGLVVPNQWSPYQPSYLPVVSALQFIKPHSHVSSHLILQDYFSLIAFPFTRSTPNDTHHYLVLKYAKPFGHLRPLHLLFLLPRI